MKKRAVILIIDSLGVGVMDDYENYRKEDKGANTFFHILDHANYIHFPNLERLGINQIVQHQRLDQTVSPAASYGCAKLMHTGADSYMGHQEIMGSRPLPPLILPFRNMINEVQEALQAQGYKAEAINGDHPVLLVEDCVVVADNIETDYGQIYNVTAPLDQISFEEELKIGQIVRAVVKSSRVITLGGRGIGIQDIVNAIETTKEGATGVNCPKSGVYRSGYQVKHMGYGINPKGQTSSILIKAGIPVTLVGKMADVIDCQGAAYIEAIETDQVMCEVNHAFRTMETGLISATVQETDLSGHAQDVNRYASKINAVDAFLTDLLEQMEEDDLLIVSADHGNDPTIGHNQHTREKTFILGYRKGKKAVNIGERETLSDIGATVCEFFDVAACENGKSFY